MVESQGLKSGLESVQQVESQEEETGYIENVNPEKPEFFNDHGSQVMVMLSVVNHLFHVSVSEFGLDVEIKKVDHQENQDDQGRMDHELGKEGGLGIIVDPVPFAPGQPVDYLDDQSINNVEEDPAEKDDFKDLDNNIRGHEMGCDVEDPWILKQDHGKVDTQVYQQEDGKEQPGQCHHQLFTDAGIKDVAHFRKIYGYCKLWLVKYL